MAAEIDTDELGARIRRARMRKGICQYELIAEINDGGINQSLLSSLECCTPKKRSRETVDKIKRICDHLEIRVPYKPNGANGKGNPFGKDAAAQPSADKPEPNLTPTVVRVVGTLKPELTTMEICSNALDKLPDAPTKLRVLRWLDSYVAGESVGS